MSGELSKLQAPKGANRPRRIKARGIAGGQGKTAGRGGKGQSARKSGQVRIGFEGGQMPLQRRLPKRGFRNPFRKRWAEINVADLNRFSPDVVVDFATLREHGLARGQWDGVKILGDGDLSVAVSVRVNRISKSAQEKIEKAGGKIELIPDPQKWVREDSRAQRRAAKKQKTA